MATGANDLPHAGHSWRAAAGRVLARRLQGSCPRLSEQEPKRPIRRPRRSGIQTRRVAVAFLNQFVGKSKSP